MELYRELADLSRWGGRVLKINVTVLLNVIAVLRLRGPYPRKEPH